MGPDCVVYICLIRRLCGEHILPFYCRMIIEPFTLIYSIYLGKILAFTINSISSAFQSWKI